MYFCPIVPIAYLDSLARLSNHHMVLVQWLSEPEYLNFYRDRCVEDYVILDNGCCELGESVPLDELISGYEALHGLPDVVVIPDIREGNNIEMFEVCGQELRKNVSSFTTLMGVPQSESDLDYMTKSPLADHIGLTRDWGIPGYNRSKLVGQYSKCGKTFHMLGIYKDSVSEVDSVRNFGCVIGIDSSVPFCLVFQGRRVRESRPHPGAIDMLSPMKSKAELGFMVRELKEYIEWVEKS